jgi:anti-sigma factor RsiW
VSEEGLDPRDAVLEVLLDGGIDPARRDELRTIIERDPGAAAELAEFERIDDLLRTAGPMLEPSDDLFARVLAIPDEVQPEVDPAWNLAAVDEPDVTPLAAASATSDNDAPWDESAAVADDERPSLLDVFAPPPPRLTPRPQRLGERGGFLRNIVVWRAAAVGFAAAALILGVMVVTDDDNSSTQEAAETVTQTVTAPGAEEVPTGPSVALTPAAGEPAGSLVAGPATEDGQTVHIVIDGLPNTPKRVYTVWVAQNPQSRIALGTFRPDENGKLDVTVTVPKLPPAFKNIWVTREPQTGKKGWSQDWIVKGPIAGQAS